MALPSRMPAFFLGHGNPMNALETNRFTLAWQAAGAAAPRPRATLVVSAHWYTGTAAVTGMDRPRTIHDFSGFPKELFAVRYPAPGDPLLAEEIAEVVKPMQVGVDRDSWGLDHGAWSLLVHMFPKADIPVLQLSIDARRPFDWHVELGARLAPLRERGVLLVASGNVVHNLRALEWSRPEFGFEWARRFDEAAREVVVARPGEAAALASHADYARAAPTPDHFLPLLYFAGLAVADGGHPHVLVEGCAFGGISMTCYGLGDE